MPKLRVAPPLSEQALSTVAVTVSTSVSMPARAGLRKGGGGSDGEQEASSGHGPHHGYASRPKAQEGIDQLEIELYADLIS